jgi:4,4'-diaponeurosporenoate glycosyltransferase
VISWWVVAGLAAAVVLAARVHRLPTGTARGRVSVVVPARDEEERLPDLLAALASDPPDELIVVDDGSTDATAALARTAGARVIEADPPPGWTGKSWACRQGAEAASGDVVVFLDADTTPRPGFVARLAADAERTAGLVSVQPHHRVARLDERLSATVALVAVLGAGTGRRPVGYGPAMAVPRTTYLATGGHDLAASDVAEDLALAAGLHRAGVPVHAYLDDGSGVTVRMYPGGWRSLVEGWTKNLAAGAGGVAWWRSLLVAVWVTGALRAIGDGPLAHAVVAAQHLVLLRLVGRFGVITALVWPLPLVVFVGLFVRSVWRRVLRREVTWRGRQVRA